MRFFFLLLLCGSCYGLGCSNNPYFQEAGPLATTESGSVVGKYVKVFDTEVAAFLGIPFAEPPLGEKRFAKPTPVEPWGGILDATKKPPPCMQYSSRNVPWLPTSKPSEDCLFLNVWVPAKCCCTSPSRLPVLVWIHGGGLYSGSTDMDLYDGSTLASYGNAIVASINYRVGPFGFLYTGQSGELGNAGLYDQNLGLQWIRNNIAHFGGDPQSITIMGESAGAWSVALHMVSPLSRNLFHRAIIQSGSPFHPQLADSVQMAIFKTNALAQIAGCRNESDESNFGQVIQCLKKKDPFELAIASDFFTSKNPILFLPTVGDEFLPTSPIQAFQSGDFAQVDVLMGVNQNEGTLFLNYFVPDVFDLDHKPVLTLEAAKNVVRALFATVADPPADVIFKHYFQNISTESDEAIVQTLADTFGDYVFNCPAMFLAEDMKKTTYFYWNTHRSVWDSRSSWVGVPHFDEVAYVFGLPIHDTYKYTPEDARFSGELIQNWITFAQRGHPGHGNWPRFTADQPFVFQLNPRAYQKLAFPRQSACEFWRPYFTRRPE